MNGRRRECTMCKKLIAFRVWARWDGSTEPPPVPPPRDDRDIRSLLGGVIGQSIQSFVCADHIDHFEKGWAKMSGVPAGTVVVGHEPAKPPPPLPRGHHVEPEVGYDGELRWGAGMYLEGYGFVLNCRTTTPESAIGRPVTLVIPEALIVPVLNRLKEAAIEQRQKPLSEAGP